jgi:phosphatidylglycerol---prolipoprotein diacylglyceryl transferase
VHPVAFHIGSLPVHWFGVFVAAGFLAGFWTAARRARREGIPAESIYDAGLWLILGAIVGARSLYVASFWKEQFANAPWSEMFMIQKGGLVFYGGLIGATLSCLIFLWKNKLPVWKFADTLAPSIALGSFFGRFGCLMNGCCFGSPTHAPWAIRFPHEHESVGDPVHPVQIYDSLLNIVFFAALVWLHRRKKFDGQIFALYLMGYAVLRTVVESFRGDYAVRYLGGIATPAQILGIGIFLAGAVLYARLPRPAAAVKAG